MSDIGKRAAEAVRAKSAEYETSCTFECECLGITRTHIYRWERFGNAPSAETLRKMLLAGYDVEYILTGGG